MASIFSKPVVDPRGLCPLCHEPMKDGQLSCDCDSGCMACSETSGARAGGLSPHFACECSCHFPLSNAIAAREAGGPLCGECGSLLVSGLYCPNEGGCGRYVYVDDYDSQPSYRRSYMDGPLDELTKLRDEIAAFKRDETKRYLDMDIMPF